MINDLDHSITFADLDHFIRLQKHLSLNKSSLLDMSLLNQIPLLIGSLCGWRYTLRMLIFFLLLLLLLQLLLGLFGKCRNCPCLKEVVNASQALNYCKHMVMIYQEAMAGNHSLRRCKSPMCNWTCFIDCQEWQLASANFGGSWYQKRELLVRCRLSMQRL